MRHRILLVCPKDFSNLPTASPVDIRKQRAVTRRQLSRLTRIEEIVVRQVHQCLHRSRLTHGHAGFVPLEEAGERRRLPLQLEVRGEAEDEDDVERSVADDLVGDRDVTGPRVMCRWAGQRLAAYLSSRDSRRSFSTRPPV